MKAVVLLSNGIDSPVAAHMMKAKGLELVFLNLNMGSGKGQLERLKCNVSPDSELITIDFLPIIKEISNANSRYTCILCKRAMLRKAQEIAFEKGAEAIVTGENLGQVASQTLGNLGVIDAAVSIPVLRPLLCLDKAEIIERAREIGTYDISIEKNKSCKFVPKQPVTKAKLKYIEKEESLVNNIDLP